MTNLGQIDSHFTNLYGMILIVHGGNKCPHQSDVCKIHAILMV